MLCRSLEVSLDVRKLVGLLPEPGLEILVKLERIRAKDSRVWKVLPVVRVWTFSFFVLLFHTEQLDENSHSLIPFARETRFHTATNPPDHPHLNLDEVLQGGSRRRIHWHPLYKVTSMKNSVKQFYSA